MPEKFRSLPISFWIGCFFLLTVLALAYLLAQLEAREQFQKKFPVINAGADFTLTNQDGQITTLTDLTNHVWVADIIFTRCAGPCPRMTAQMKSLQDLLPQNGNAKLVTLTTDPDFDSPPILKKYGERFDADFNRWTFLTGTKKEIAGLASQSLKLSAQPIDPTDQKSVADLFIHTTIFVLVDKHAQLRGIFETGGEGVDWTNSVEPDLLKTIRQLERAP
jgi:protein SCO1/2